MPDISLPFDPLRGELYDAADLFAGFSPADPDSYGRCADIEILRFFVRYGKNPPTDNRAGTLEALHDNAISEATQGLLRQSQKVVAIMGGHGMIRGTAPYTDIAHIAHALASRGFFIVSGGGPGAMEASHLGAAFAGLALGDLDAAIGKLGQHAELPKDAANLVRPDGTVDASIARALHGWISPALSIVSELAGAIRPSLGVPTWLYGYEPTTPFATHIAKYFQNSLREDGLVSLGNQGIVYSEGSAGTVQEIFQDAARCFYGTLSPMVFLSSPAAPGDHYWEKALPVRAMIEALLGKKADFAKKVQFVDSVQATVDFISTQ
jgi:predicted Rossmann-fold nucleotide-binding protein